MSFAKCSYENFADIKTARLSVRKDGYKFVEAMSNRGDVHELYVRGHKVVALKGKYIPLDGYRYYLMEIR